MNGASNTSRELPQHRIVEKRQLATNDKSLPRYRLRATFNASFFGLATISTTQCNS